jgi:hypothetical protein
MLHQEKSGNPGHQSIMLISGTGSETKTIFCDSNLPRLGLRRSGQHKGNTNFHSTSETPFLMGQQEASVNFFFLLKIYEAKFSPLVFFSFSPSD